MPSEFTKQYQKDFIYQHYTDSYMDGEVSDSPDKTRTSMAERIFKSIQEGFPNNTYLNIGSGPQPLEAEFWDTYKKRWVHGKRLQEHDIKFYTLDIAYLPPHQLQCDEDLAKHIQADVEHLPFKEGAFGLVVSNLALDLLSPQVVEQWIAEGKSIKEEYTNVVRSRVQAVYNLLAAQGKAILYLHHPLFIPEQLQGRINEEEKRLRHLQDFFVFAKSEEQQKLDNAIALSKSQIQVFRYWKLLQDYKLLFQSLEEIKKTCEDVGFSVVEMKANSEKVGRSENWWWEAVVQKPNSKHVSL